MLPCSKEKGIDLGLRFIYKKKKKFLGRKQRIWNTLKHEANGFISKKKRPFEEK